MQLVFCKHGNDYIHFSRFNLRNMVSNTVSTRRVVFSFSDSKVVHFQVKHTGSEQRHAFYLNDLDSIFLTRVYQWHIIHLIHSFFIFQMALKSLGTNYVNGDVMQQDGTDGSGSGSGLDLEDERDDENTRASGSGDGPGKYIFQTRNILCSECY